MLLEPLYRKTRTNFLANLIKGMVAHTQHGKNKNRTSWTLVEELATHQFTPADCRVPGTEEDSITPWKCSDFHESAAESWARCGGNGRAAGHRPSERNISHLPASRGKLAPSLASGFSSGKRVGWACWALWSLSLAPCGLWAWLPEDTISTHPPTPRASCKFPPLPGPQSRPRFLDTELQQLG